MTEGVNIMSPHWDCLPLSCSGTGVSKASERRATALESSRHRAICVAEPFSFSRNWPLFLTGVLMGVVVALACTRLCRRHTQIFFGCHGDKIESHSRLYEEG